MTRESSPALAATPQRVLVGVRQLQWITIVWMTIELTFAVFLGVRAHSIALTAFGADSGMELLSAIVVLRRFHIGSSAEQVASRINAALLYALAVFIVLTSLLSLLVQRLRPEPSYIGIALLIAAALVMPWLGRQKRRLARDTGSGALRADAAQSSLCAYMSWIALLGLAASALFHLFWADAVAALLLIPLVLREANESRRGNACSC